MSYKRLIPCIFIAEGKAVKWFDDKSVLSEDVIGLSKIYSENGADELLVFDLSQDDDEHEENINLMRKMNRVIRIPMIAGGNVKRLEDIKKILYAGAKRAIVNFSKPESAHMVEEAARRFGREKIAVSLNDFDGLFKHQRIVKEYCSGLVFMNLLDLNSVMDVTDIPSIKGVSGKYMSRPDMDFTAFKERCEEEGIHMTSFESMMEFSQLKTNEQGLIPVIVQHYKTQQVLMMAYMNEDAFYRTMKTGKMTYYSRSRQSLWVKGETSGHYQYVRSLILPTSGRNGFRREEPVQGV